MAKGRPGARAGALISFNAWGGCTDGSTADNGVVGRVESASEDERDVKDVSTEVVTVAAPPGKHASTKVSWPSSGFSSTSASTASRWGSSTETPADCGGGFLLRDFALLGGNEPSVNEYQGSYLT